MTAAGLPTAPAPSRALAVEPVGPATWDLQVRGAFDLGQSLRFGFGQRAAVGSGPMRLAFCLDDTWEPVAAVVTAPAPGVVRIGLVGDAAPERILSQVARVLSVDVDATGYDELGRRDPLVGRLQRARPGLRPPLFHSAYEALCWSVLSARRPAVQMAQVRDRLGREHGRVFSLAGAEAVAFPSPERLLRVADVPGLPPVKVERLHAVARAALDGALGTDALRRLAPAEAAASVQRLPGIGPFYSELVVIRTLGHTDVLPTAEVGAAEIAGALLGRPLDADGLARLGPAWAPWRTWVCVALRAAGPHVPAAGSPADRGDHSTAGSSR